MNKSFGNEDPALERAITEIYQPEDDVLREIRERAQASGLPDIQVAALDARHLEILVRITGVRRAVEIGTLAGYSAVSMARGLLPGGLLFSIDADARHADVAAESFRRAGCAEKVRLLRGSAHDLLPTLSGEGPFDFCFIDADKESYDEYLDWASRHLRPGGVVVGDNAFLFGDLKQPLGPVSSPAARAMHAFHDRLARGGEFRATVLPTGEGMAVGVKV
jgi:caffeoyl-CoA O-methyltransferase